MCMGNERLNGLKLKAAMEVKDISNGALAAHLGISHSMLSQLKEGYIPRRNRDEILARLASFVGCEVSDLLLPAKATEQAS